jgi:hypothetical protein
VSAAKVVEAKMLVKIAKVIGDFINVIMIS